jgi:hypothetical protein
MHYGPSDPHMAVLLDRQTQIGGEIREIRDGVNRIEQKIDHGPKNGNGRQGIMIGGAWFKDIKSALLWLAILLMITGHLTLAEIKQMLLR